MTHTKRVLVTLGVALALLAGCGDDDTATSTTPTSGPTTTAAPGGDTTSTGDAATTSEDATTTTSEDGVDSSTTGQLSELEQPAIWPAADVVFATPEEAAADFVTSALGVPAELGEFQQGDARSGEIEVFSPGEGEQATPITRGLLLLRQLGPNDGWFVIAAVNDNAAITSPSAGAEVVAGPLSVEGVGRGFEANVVVRAFAAGDAGAPLDEVITQGGAFEAPEPISVSLDLSGAAPGEVVMLLVRGGTGLESDPGDFGAIPVVIAG
jgi:hypothetical protein